MNEYCTISEDFFGHKGRLARHLTGFQPRAGQQKMVTAIADLITKEPTSDQETARLLIVEAETGIGKTLAYLVPALLAGQRVVVSTATKHLQDQIMKKEVPLLEKVLGQKIPAVCLKGRQNYLCKYRWYQLYTNSQMSLVKDNELQRIEAWMQHTQTGDRAELTWLPDTARLWYRISAKPDQCLGSDCPEWAHCYVNQTRKMAGSTLVLVVNHHLFFSDLVLRQGGYGELLPRYEGVIFDEAHHIENIATSFFGNTLSQYQFLDLFADIEILAEQELSPDDYKKTLATVRGIKKRSEEFFALFPSKRGRFPLDIFISSLGENSWNSEIDLLAMGLERLVEILDTFCHHSEGWKNLERRGKELLELLSAIAFPDPQNTSYVYWYERRERSVALAMTPIEVAEHLQTTLYAGVSWCVMTSATLSSGGDFRYLRQRLGLPETTPTLRLHSPFDYAGKTVLYVPENNFPIPSAQEYQEAACDTAYRLLEQSQGHGLVLCTSFRGMEAMADYLEMRLTVPLLVQGEGSKHALLEEFRRTKQSVLIAVASFWEGVDIPGDALRCVIIDKLPFEVPSDPVIQARIQAITEKGGKPFFEFQIPRAILTLRQGVGRLMRSIDDWGILGILDVRLFSKGYGRTFLQSLPPSPVVRSIADVAAFYHNQRELEDNSHG